MKLNYWDKGFLIAVFTLFYFSMVGFLTSCKQQTEFFHEPSEIEFVLHDEGVDAAITNLAKANYERIQEIHEIKHRLDHLEKVHLHISDASSDSAVFRHEDGRYVILWVNEDDAKEVIR